MKAFAPAVIFAMSALLAGATEMQVNAVSSLRFDESAAKNRPVSKVITLLKDMLKQMEKEGKEDEELYDKMACWCETNDKEKTKSIADAENRIEDLTSKVEELTAATSRLTTEIGQAEKELAKSQEALDEATQIRQKQLAEFNAEEKDSLGSISALRSAVTVLSKHHTSLLQMPVTHVRRVAATMQKAMEQQGSLLNSVLNHEERRAVTNFIQTPDSYAEPSLVQSDDEQPQSGQIYGILKQMKESFETNLASSQKEEQENQQAYEDLKNAKNDEIAASQDQVDTKQEQLADATQTNSQSKEDLEDTTKTLEADQEFLAMLKEKCANTDKQWEARQKARAEEMEACSKALAVLSSDDAHDLFAKTFNPALVQVGAKVHSERRSKASKVLSAIAQKIHSPRLSTLAIRVRFDAIEKVKEKIDVMVGEMKKEKEDEIKHKDFCTDEFNKNDMETEEKNRDKEDSVGKIDDLKAKMEDGAKAIEEIKAEIKEMQVELKRAGEDREKENKEFQMTIADQRATQKLLGAALKILKGFYAKKEALIQRRQEQRQEFGQAPPPGFDEMKTNESSGGVMGMLEQIIRDAQAMEKDAIREEEDGQKMYEQLVKETNASVQAKGKDVVNKSEKKSRAEADLVAEKESLSKVMLELEQLSNSKAELHESCDFIMKNFEIRQTARDEEVEALKQAKAILSGAKFSAFLQSSL